MKEIPTPVRAEGDFVIENESFESKNNLIFKIF